MIGIINVDSCSRNRASFNLVRRPTASCRSRYSLSSLFSLSKARSWVALCIATAVGPAQTDNFVAALRAAPARRDTFTCRSEREIWSCTMNSARRPTLW